MKRLFFTSLIYAACIVQGLSAQTRTICPNVYLIDDKGIVYIPTDSSGFHSAILNLGYQSTALSDNTTKYTKTSSVFSGQQILLVNFESGTLSTLKQSILGSSASILSSIKRCKDSLTSQYGACVFTEPNVNELRYTWSAKCGMPNKMGTRLGIQQNYSSASAYLAALEYCADECVSIDHGKDGSIKFTSSLDLGFALSLASTRSTTTLGSASVIARVSYAWAEYITFIQPSKDVFPMGDLSMYGISFGVSIPITQNSSIDVGAAFYSGKYSIYSSTTNQMYSASGTDWQPCGGLRLALGERAAATFHYDADRGVSVGVGIRGDL